MYMNFVKFAIHAQKTGLDFIFIVTGQTAFPIKSLSPKILKTDAYFQAEG